MSSSSPSQQRGIPSSEHDLQGVGLYGVPRPLPLPPEPSPYPENVLEALPQSNRKAFVALALGLAGLALGLLTGIPAMIYGYLASGEIRRSVQFRFDGDPESDEHGRLERHVAD